jgi:hypothetical protein
VETCKSRARARARIEIRKNSDKVTVYAHMSAFKAFISLLYVQHEYSSLSIIDRKSQRGNHGHHNLALQTRHESSKAD